MTRILGTRSKKFAQRFAAILLGSASLVSFASAGSDAIVRTDGGVSYVSGGVGTDSIDRLGSLAADFNLKLVFALKSGEYVSGVSVAITDAAGKTLLDTTSDGPWLLTKLPVGNYHIVATFAGNAAQRQIAVNATKLRTVDFRWASALGREAAADASGDSQHTIHPAVAGAESLER